MSPRSQKRQKSNITFDSIEFFKLTNKPDFRDKVENIRKTLNIDSYDLDNSPFREIQGLDENEDLYGYLLNYHVMQEYVDEILEKYSLSESWFQSVFDYIVEGRKIIVDPNFKLDGSTIVHNIEKGTLSIELGANSTLEEIIMMWPKIQRSMGTTFGRSSKRKKPSKMFFRDYLIYNMHQRGMTVAEIHREIMKEEKQDLDFGNIKTIISRFKKQYYEN